MPRAGDLEKTSVQTSATVQRPHRNVLFARTLILAEKSRCKQRGLARKPRDMKWDSVLIAMGTA